MVMKSAGKCLYGAGFTVVLPIGLVAWASATADAVTLPRIFSPAAGWSAAFAGAVLLLLGILHLRTYGGGLPMNAYPPPRYVDRGVYRLLPHPIYTGFVALCAGVSVATGSASGLWLVSPVVALGCAALVLGYENHDLAERFGREPRRLLPAPGDLPVSPSRRLACYVFVLAPWLVLYGAVSALVPTPGAVGIAWLGIPYFSVYPFVALAPLLAERRDDLREFCLRALRAMPVAFCLYLAVPLAAQFPSFQVIWAVLAASLYARRWPRLAWAFRTWALLVAASCAAAGRQPLASIAAGFVTAWLAARGPALWDAIRRAGERVANSWHEWRIGPVRIINHGFYAGAGAFLGLWIAASLAGPEARLPLLVAALAGVVAAGLWAQYIEGSPQLLRPFGFYGGLLGGSLAALLAPLFGVSAWLVLAALCTAGPWAQAFGRLRCLVQGCCHGRPAPKSLGICYTHPRSRVCRLAGWAGVPLHPTPVYSILWNAFIALAATRLWTLHAPLHLIAGIYFILSGLGRFVEESWASSQETVY
jgi:prolipoprotein diacylglyceryltransferase/protein-S-isoprenylcysteine O-methyltransferase Ste14